MLERYRGALLAGLIFAAFLIAFLALVHPRAFAQTMGEYGNVLNNSNSGASFKPPQFRPSQSLHSHAKFQSDIHAADSAKTFKSSTDTMKSNTFRNTRDFDTRNDFRTGNEFKAPDGFRPSFKAN
jgi:hypothetical protein